MSQFAVERRPWREGAAPGSADLLALGDDELLHRIQVADAELPPDAQLLAVVKSDRHFFLRQEAAKRLRDKGPLKEYANDRHIGQILARSMTRGEDRDYLQKLMTESRHLEVRKAAEHQLRTIPGPKEP